MTLRELQFAGKLLAKGDQTREFRRIVMQMVVDQTKELFSNNLYVRIQAALILSELNLTEVDPRKNLPLEGFGPALDPLADVLLDPEQHEAVKIVAANGIYRLLRTSAPEAKLKIKVADALVKEFARTDTHFWYQLRLAAALSACDVSLDFNRQPFVVNVLLKAISDPQRPFAVRAEAARALGRVPIEPSVDYTRLLHELGVMAHALGTAAQQNPNDTEWPRCFLKLYYAFQPRDPNEMGADRKTKAGLLSRTNNPSATRALYNEVLPLINAGLNQQPIPAASLSALDSWIKKNAPAGVPVVNSGGVTGQ